ncbi:MAG: hypothetical protein WCA07_06845 [Gloeobacterales cyanobacterium]
MSKSPTKKRSSPATRLKWLISLLATVSTLAGWQAFAAQEATPVNTQLSQPAAQEIVQPAVIQPVQQPSTLKESQSPALIKQSKVQAPAVRSAPKTRPAPVTTTRSSR